MERKKIVKQHYFRLILASMAVALASAVLAFSLKHLTEFLQDRFFSAASGYTMLYILLPSVGITTI
ncbi:hypothetical protein [Marnyiella aurantia]|uniref:hypothetical protein n=1 Tax=Marnyiella aurantia TaxID=2758037 RepID=UPI001FD832DF|nr:hypothetical protein [Marnyiella aurantia]